MSMAEMDLGNAIFEYGQTYVALSRIRTLDGLYLSSFMPNKIKANPKVVAFYEMFTNMVASKPPENEEACEIKQVIVEESTSKIISVYKKPTYIVKKLE